MRDKESKKKLHESKIGKIIYGFLLFMPLFAIGVTCGYAMFNKNAYQSYMGSAEYLTSTNYNTYITNKNIPFESYTDGQYTNYTISSTNFNNIDVIRNTSQNHGQGIYGFNANSVILNGTKYSNIQSFVFGNVGTSWWYLQTYDFILTTDYFLSKIDNFTINVIYNDTVMNAINTVNVLNNSNKIQLNANLSGNTIFTNLNVINNYSLLTTSTLDLYTNDTTLSSVFYSSVNKVTQSNLFNWVTTSNIYTGMSNFTSAMSVTNTFIPMLLTYWLIISVIYFLYDMVLVLLTVLHRKIHNLQDSI